MAANLISSFFANTPAAFVDDLTNRPCWIKIKTVDAEILSENEVTSNPMVSNGATISEISKDLIAMKVIAPARVTLTVTAIDTSAISSILSTFENVNSTITVTLRGITAKNLVLSSIELLQEPERLSNTKLVLNLEQAALPKNIKYAPEQGADSSSYNLGIKKLSSAAAQIGELSTKIKGFILGT